MKTKKLILSMTGVFVLGLIVGAALLYNNSIYNAVQDALNGGATQNTVAQPSGVSQVNVSNMDLETALRLVQEQRAQLLEQEMTDRISAIEANNSLVVKLNVLLVIINGELAKLPANASSNHAVKLAADINSKFTEVSIAIPLTKADLVRVQGEISSKITAGTSSQQMDMVRLQSLTDKRNEAFDVMTEFVKKMQESRSSIIGNMR